MEHGVRGRTGPIPSLLTMIVIVLAPAPVVALEDSELFLLDVRADDFQLAESVPAIASGETYLIDFELFLEAIEFPIERSQEAWSGWFYEEDRIFFWRPDSGSVRISGREDEFVESSDWHMDAEGVYVAVGVLESWFDLTLKVDPRDQTLSVSSDEPLPFEVWHQREMAKYTFRPGQKIDADVIVPDQYRWATMPMFNLNTHMLSQNFDGEMANGGTATLVMGMDLLKHSVIYTGGLTHTRHDLGNDTEMMNRLTVERASLTPDEPLFAGVNRYILGDIYIANPNLVVNSSIGRGFSIDRYPEGRTGSLGRVTISGNAPPGWSVELYRNGTLMDFTTVGLDGRYFFPDMETPFGENIFIAKLFGPQGQTREDRQVFWGGGSDLDEGDFDFSVGHIDFDTYALDGRRDEADGLSASYATDFRYAYGLTDDLKLGAGLTQAGVNTRERSGDFTDSQYASLFGRAKIWQGVLVGELVKQLDLGQAWSLEYLTGFNGHNVSLTHRAYSNFESPATLQYDDLKSFNEVAFTGPFGGYRQNSYTLKFTHRNMTQGNSDFRVFNQLGFRLGAVSLSNDVEYVLTSGPNTGNGRLKVASRVKKVSVRAQAEYQFDGRGRPLKQLSADMNFSINKQLTNNLTVVKNFESLDVMYLTNLMSLNVGNYDLTFSVSSDFDNSYSVGAGFNVSFGYDDRRESFITDRRSLADSGRATMNLFIDDNNNGVRDPGEAPVEWATYRDQETLEGWPGTLPLTALPTSRPVQIDTRHIKFDDPFLMPRAKAYQLQTHAGSDVSVDVAVVMTGDIEGYVFAGSSDNAPAKGVVISLHDSKGRRVARTRSEFDGFFSFTSVAGGDYEVRVSSSLGGDILAQSFTLDARQGYVVLDAIYLPKAKSVKETSPSHQM
jgi:hypothetical protein